MSVPKYLLTAISAAAGAIAIFVVAQQPDSPVLLLAASTAVVVGFTAYAWPLTFKDYRRGAKTMLPTAAVISLIALPNGAAFIWIALIVLAFGLATSGLLGKTIRRRES